MYSTLSLAFHNLNYFLIHSLETESGVNSDDLVDWKSLKIKRIPKIRHNPELFFRRWNHLKSRAEIGKVENEDFKGQLEKVKKYLIGLCQKSGLFETLGS